MEYDEKYGYASINTFSKSILNLSVDKNYFSLLNINSVIIVVQVHVFYEDVFKKIIKRLNYMPLKYVYIYQLYLKKRNLILKKYY